MGLIRTGILGGFRKKTGTVVGAYWRKLDTIRALPRVSGKAPSQLQKEQQAKFALVTGFLSNFGTLIDKGFANASETKSPMNRAVAYHLANSVIGTYPDYTIDMDMFSYSQGSLELPTSFTLATISANTVTLSWVNEDVVEKRNHPTDLATFVAYNLDTKRHVKAIDAVERSVGTYDFLIPESYSGSNLIIYASFSSGLKKNVNSPSVIVGTLLMP